MRLFTLIVIVFPSIAFSQNATKDERSREKKEDTYNQYNADNISKISVLKALEMAGVNIFYIPLDKFDKKYRFEITLDEYVNSEKVKTKNISVSANNQYVYYKNEKQHFDYIDNFQIFSRNMDTVAVLKIETYAGAVGGIKLRQNKMRESQFYNWRTYSKTKWVLNKDVPVLVFASSWFDDKNKVERFCGTADLSINEKDTQDLLENSPHYFIISYIISPE